MGHAVLRIVSVGMEQPPPVVLRDSSVIRSLGSVVMLGESYQQGDAAMPLRLFVATTAAQATKCVKLESAVQRVGSVARIAAGMVSPASITSVVRQAVQHVVRGAAHQAVHVNKVACVALPAVLCVEAPAALRVSSVWLANVVPLAMCVEQRAAHQDRLASTGNAAQLAVLHAWAMCAVHRAQPATLQMANAAQRVK